jgi:hypothetical protein
MQYNIRAILHFKFACIAIWARTNKQTELALHFAVSNLTLAYLYKAPVLATF